MLTCEFPPTSGDATLAGFSVTNEPEKTRRRIGYCPQFDAHFQNMTGREHIQLYAAIKGVPKDQVENAVASKLAEVGLNEFDSNRLSQGYSGGMKRKLSVACATVGQPQIVFLDEPSTGMDPVARRDMWRVISEMVSGGNIPDEERTSVILTTHAMEECEALCPRIGIMANGKLRCLGSAQHLKDRFGQGYQVELKVQFVDDHDDDYRATVVKLAEIIGKEVKLPKIKAVEDAAGAGAQVNTEAKDDGEGDAKKEGEDQKEADAPVAVVTKDEENGDDQLVDVVEGGPQDVFLSFDEVISSLKSLTGDDSLADKVNPDDPNGYTVYKNAKTLVGASLEEIATFAVSELRMAALDAFFSEHFESFVLRERQDVKARYEVGAAGVRISSIFGKIEENKGRLKLSDYGVSQTSLEQVFNMHAAEAEKLKYGTTDG
jgi:ABC-type multidrug transport system ATPase subunit